MKYKYKDYENENNKNEIEIIFNNNENKDYPIKMNVNKEEDINKIIEYLLDKHPELKKHKDIKKIKVNGNDINFEESLDIETNNHTTVGPIHFH